MELDPIISPEEHRNYKICQIDVYNHDQAILKLRMELDTTRQQYGQINNTEEALQE